MYPIVQRHTDATYGKRKSICVLSCSVPILSDSVFEDETNDSIRALTDRYAIICTQTESPPPATNLR